MAEFIGISKIFAPYFFAITLHQNHNGKASAPKWCNNKNKQV